MAEEVRIYPFRAMRMIQITVLGVFLVLFILFLFERISTNLSPLLIYSIVVLFGGIMLLGWVGWYRKGQRLELTPKLIRFVSYGYTLEAAWEDIERIAPIKQTTHYKRIFQSNGLISMNRGYGLIANKYAVKRTKYIPFLEWFGNYEYDGILIEPDFTSNIYAGELSDDIRRHAPHIFEGPTYPV